MIEDALLLQGIVSLVAILVVMIFLFEIIGKVFTKSREYRKLLADMFVVGKIKQLAAADKIDVLAELSEYAKFMKAKHISCEDLDNTIERELQEKISNTSSEKSSEKEKK